MPFQILLFAIGLLLLIKGGDWFVDSASGIAHRFHLPELLIGATVVSIGTTLPEVMVSAQGAAAGVGAMAYGNAIGSIICNTSLIAALTIAIRPGKAERKSMILPVSFFFVTAAFYATVAYASGTFERWVGIVLLSAFIIYMLITVLSMKSNSSAKEPVLPADAASSQEEESTACEFSLKSFIIEALVIAIGGGFMIYKSGIIGYFGIAMIAVFAVYALFLLFTRLSKKQVPNMARNIFFLVIGSAIIAGGANLLVDSGTFIATELGVPATVISLTFVALGTSLPELVTAITSLAKGHSSLSLGNIIGANLFNIVLVSGVSTVIAPFDVPAEATLFGINASFVLDIPLMLTLMGIMVIPTLIRGKLSRVQGVILLTLYAAFCTMQFTVFA